MNHHPPLVVLNQAVRRFYFQHRHKFASQQNSGREQDCMLPFFSHRNPAIDLNAGRDWDHDSTPIRPVVHFPGEEEKTVFRTHL